jgi:hypothetical protein
MNFTNSRSFPQFLSILQVQNSGNVKYGEMRGQTGRFLRHLIKPFQFRKLHSVKWGEKTDFMIDGQVEIFQEMTEAYLT